MNGDAAGAGAAERGVRKALVGIVVSDKMDKTLVVAVERHVAHRLYGRRMRRTKRYKVHDAANEAHLGDRVEMAECRPISKEKTWRLVRVLERAR